MIDTHASGTYRIGWLGRGRIAERRGRASEALPLIGKLVQKGKPEGICVVAGPGSFTSVRTGVLYANLLARLWRVPLVGLSVSDLAALAVSADLAVSYVSPVYDAEPNITIATQP